MATVAPSLPHCRHSGVLWPLWRLAGVRTVSSMAFTLLPSLHPRDRHAVIRVRVCRKWEFRAGGTDDGSIIHIDLVLVDEKDTFMPVPGNYMIEFTYHTMVNPVTDDTLAIPELIYHLTPFADLERHAGVYSHFTDVIGVLVQVSDSKVVHLRGKPNPTITRDIVLRDLSYFEIKVSLWGHRAASFTIDTIYDPNESKPIVVLLVGTIVKTFQGQHYLSAGAACRWFFNPPIPEAEMFYNSLNDQRIEIRHSAATINQPRGPALAQAEITTLTQLDTMDTYAIGDSCYRCTVVIARLVPGERWWFPSCARCNKSSIQEGSGYKCKTCLSTVAKFKYKLAFVATDGTTEAKMISFDNTATRIIGKPVQQLMRAGKPIEDFPPDIAAVVSLKFTFAIALSDQSFKSSEKSYRVLSVLTAHGRQTSVPHSVITAGASGVQTQAIGSYQQHTALEGHILEASAETEVPKDSDKQEAATSPPQTISKMVELPTQPSHHTPGASNIQTTPSDCNRAAHSAKKGLTKNPTPKNIQPAARRKLSFSGDKAPMKTIASAPGAKKQRGQKTSTSTPDDDAIVADATSDTDLPYNVPEEGVPSFVAAASDRLMRLRLSSWNTTYVLWPMEWDTDALQILACKEMRIHPNICSENTEMDKGRPALSRRPKGPGGEEEPDPDRGLNLRRAEAAAREQEQPSDGVQDPARPRN
ncbi:hypothetical protein U9M48_004992, partial [Paspalum notatum var. saurae]